MPFFTTDIPCPSCGYNLRGLSLGHGCPECGLKVVCNELTPGERSQMKQIEAEVEENLRQIESEEAARRRTADLLTAWEHRGQRFDQILDRLEKLLKGVSEKAQAEQR